MSTAKRTGLAQRILTRLEGFGRLSQASPVAVYGIAQTRKQFFLEFPCDPSDFSYLHRQLQPRPHLTLQLAWEEYRQADAITQGGYFVQLYPAPEIKTLGPDGEKCTDHTGGLLRRMTIKGGLQHCIGREVSRFERGKDDSIENIDDVRIHYSGGRVGADESLIAEMRTRGLRKIAKKDRA
jgi:hypothetical protein